MAVRLGAVKLELVDDLATLSKLDDDILIQQIRGRYDKDRIYVGTKRDEPRVNICKKYIYYHSHTHIHTHSLTHINLYINLYIYIYIIHLL